MKNWIRTGLLATTLSGASLIICLLLIEVTGRVTGLLEAPSRKARFSPTKGYELIPGYGDTNSYGLRDQEVSLEKLPNTYRIFAVGDSFTYGHGVQREQTWVKQLEALLNDARDNAFQYEVLNGGVPGYNTQQELIHFKEIGQQFQPDLLILQFTLNDAEGGTFGLKDIEDQMWLIRAKEWIKDHFALYRFLRSRFLRVMSRLDAAKRGVKEGDTSILPLKLAAVGKTNTEWERCRESLAAFASNARSLKIPILLVIYPLLHKI